MRRAACPQAHDSGVHPTRRIKGMPWTAARQCTEARETWNAHGDGSVGMIHGAAPGKREGSTSGRPRWLREATLGGDDTEQVSAAGRRQMDLAVVGAGTMGAGIAQVAVAHGLDVALYDAVPAA